MPDVSFVLVYVDDVARSETFYASILGRAAIGSSPTSPCCLPRPA